MSETATVQNDQQKEIDCSLDVESSDNDESRQLSGPVLMPVKALRDEQTQLEAWVHQSFSALERLHSELDQWQQELTNQQSDLDQSASDQRDFLQQFQQLEQEREQLIREREQLVQERDEALEKVVALETELEKCQESLKTMDSQNSGSGEQQEQLQKQCDQVTQQLDQTLNKVQKLEQENAAQTEELETLQLQYEQARTELESTQEKAESRVDSLTAQRKLAEEQQQQWAQELKEMRELLGRQCDLLSHGKQGSDSQDSVLVNNDLERPSAVAHPTEEKEKETGSSSTENSKPNRNDEIRQRAKDRRAAKRRNRNQ